MNTEKKRNNREKEQRKKQIGKYIMENDAKEIDR